MEGMLSMADNKQDRSPAMFSPIARFPRATSRLKVSPAEAALVRGDTRLAPGSDALEESEQRYRHLFHNMPIALLQLDLHEIAQLLRRLHADGVSDLGGYLDRNPDLVGRMMDTVVATDANDCALAMFGARDRGQLVGRCGFLWRRTPDTFRRAMESRFQGETVFQEETKLSTLDGREIAVHFVASRLGLEGDNGVGLVGVIDITDRAQVQERLQQVQAEFAHAARISMLGELSASIAHEVNQPLSAIRTSCETVLRWLDEPEPNVTKTRNSIKRILDDARRASETVARIRNMVSGQAPQRTAVVLQEVISESLLFLRHEFQLKGISVSLDLAPALSEVAGDRTQLQQVVVNLAINAAQEMAKSGAARRSIGIRTHQKDSHTVCCIIEDSGRGIDKGHLPRLFESFFTTKDAGMGLGLPIARSIIEDHGGQISADNESSLGGARFVFELPAAPSAN
jgi:signal transduction histidine kinase